MKNFFIGLLFVIIFSGLAGGGTYYYLNNKYQKDKDKLESDKTTLQTEVKDLKKEVADLKKSDIADWKTYTSAKYGFSIKYPSNYTYVEVTPTDEVGGVIYTVSFGEQPSTDVNNTISVNIRSKSVGSGVPNGMDPTSTTDKTIGGLKGKNYDSVSFAVANDSYSYLIQCADDANTTIKGNLLKMVDSITFTD